MPPTASSPLSGTSSLLAVAGRGLATVLLCAVITALLALTVPGRWDQHAVHSFGIGLTTWAVIDGGRAWLTRGSAIPWPLGWRGWVLVAAGTSLGFVAGTMLANAYGMHTPGSDQSIRSGRAGYSLVLGMLATGCMCLLFYGRGKAAHLEAAIARAERSATEARLQLLESQLEPHMMFNTLANLRVLIATEPARAQRMLDHLIDFLRATLGASRTGSHTLADEFARLADYLELMAVRMGPRLTFALELPPALAGQPVPALLLQPLVENAVRHGLEPQVGGGHVAVQARIEGPHLLIDVTDTGAGLAHVHEPGRGHGFGLAVVRDRLAAVYGAAAALAVRPNHPEGTVATLRLPLGTLPA